MRGIAKFQSPASIAATLWQNDFERPFTEAAVELAAHDGEHGVSRPREITIIVLDNATVLAEIA